MKRRGTGVGRDRRQEEGIWKPKGERGVESGKGRGRGLNDKGREGSGRIREGRREGREGHEGSRPTGQRRGKVRHGARRGGKGRGAQEQTFQISA